MGSLQDKRQTLLDNKREIEAQLREMDTLELVCNRLRVVEDKHGAFSLSVLNPRGRKGRYWAYIIYETDKYGLLEQIDLLVENLKDLKEKVAKEF